MTAGRIVAGLLGLAALAAGLGAAGEIPFLSTFHHRLLTGLGAAAVLAAAGRPGRLVLRIVATAATAALVLALAAEAASGLAARLAVPAKPRADGPRPAPFVMWDAGGGDSEEAALDANVWIVGGSASAEADSSLALLADSLGAAGFRVLDAVQPLYNSTQSLITLVLLLRTHTPPELVVLAGGPADILAAWDSGEAATPAGTGARAAAGLPDPARESSPWRRLLEESATSALVRILRGQVEPEPRMPVLTGSAPPDPQEVAAAWRLDCGLAAALAEEYGFGLMTVWSPLPPDPPDSASAPVLAELAAGVARSLDGQ